MPLRHIWCVWHEWISHIFEGCELLVKDVSFLSFPHVYLSCIRVVHHFAPSCLVILLLTMRCARISNYFVL